MLANPTGFPPLDQFDRSIPEHAKQAIKTEYERCNGADSRFARLLEDKEIISDRDVLHRRCLRLVLVDAGQEHNDYLDDPHTVAAASYLYSPSDDTALIGSISVSTTFQRRGIGTRLKRQVDNHARQDGATVSYTWIASDAGRVLARRTGYRPEREVFPDTPEIWLKNY